jgi:hypothetical protein
MFRATIWGLLCIGLSACGGSCPEAENASSASAETKPAESTSESAKESSADESEAESKHEAASESSSSSSGDKSDKSADKPGDDAASPQFPEGATVSQAMAAVPKGTPRANIDEETLAQPLQQPSLYEPCKVGSQHFKMKVAIWNGEAVGVDVTTSNKALASCIEKQVRGASWPHKVRSLNTVEYSM